jgi:hypothetical protein
MPNPATEYFSRTPTKLTPKRSAVVKRFGKVVGFSLIGYSLAGAGVLATSLLTSIQIPGELAVAGGAVIAGVAGAVQKSISWVDYGVDTPPATLGGPA